MNIAVLFGGNSSERDVSIASARQVVQALRSRGHSVTAIDTATGTLTQTDEKILFNQTVRVNPPTLEELSQLHDENTWTQLVEILKPFDVVFIALHGAPAENGEIQPLFDQAGIRYTGSNPRAHELAWKKDAAKELFVNHDIPTPKWISMPQVQGLIDELGLPLIIKPNEQGSTVGLTLIRDESQIRDALEKAQQFGASIAEAFIKGREITVGVLADKPLGVGEIVINPETIFSYDLKYQKNAVIEQFPADLPEDIYRQTQALALKAHQALGLTGYSRADFRLDEQGNLWIIEVNSLPGMTSGSLLPQSAAVEGISFEELCERICEEALKQ